MTLPKSLRPTITAPDGRSYAGLWPQSVTTPHEGPYIAALARRVGGVAEVTLPCGRADVATDTDVFEVEPVASWRTGARQSFAYAGMTGLAPHLALFGPADYLSIYLRIRDKMPGLTLWRWMREDWHRVTSRRTAGLIGGGPAETRESRPDGDQAASETTGADVTTMVAETTPMTEEAHRQSLLAVSSARRAEVHA